VELHISRNKTTKRAKMTKLAIKYIKIEDLIPYVNNSRTHNELQVSQIAASIKEFGFKNPVLVDGDNGIIAGHGRVLAATKLGLKEVPTIDCSDLSEIQKRQFIIADNKIALNAGWDEEILKLEIDDLKELGADIDILAFDPSELQKNVVDYSILDDTSDEKLSDYAANVMKAIQIEFEPQHFEEAQELVKFWRTEGAYVGYMLLKHLRDEKSKL